jgi:hypothetical protein
MSNKTLLIYNNNYFYKFKLLNKKYIGTSLFLVYKNKGITVLNNSIIIELSFKKLNKLFQLNYNIENFDDYIKNNKLYFQQTYIFFECKIILRFNLKIQLEEILIELYNNII